MEDGCDALETPDWHEAVFDMVRRIPKGKVATYGQIADAVTTVSLGPRQVGAALRYVPEGVPWQRVVGAGGRLPIARRNTELQLLQIRLLTQEGVPFLKNSPDRIDMAAAGWLTTYRSVSDEEA